MVHDPDDVESDDKDLPQAVVDAGFGDVLEIQDVKDIVSNARLQNPEITIEGLL